MSTILKSLLTGAAALPALVASSPLAINLADTSSVSKRDLTEVTCGLYASASRDIHYHVIQDLQDKGDQELKVAPHSCNRIGCYTTSGAYVCNDQDAELVLPMSEAVGQLKYLARTCMEKDGAQDIGSGRVTTTDRNGYNVNVGYCNGNHATDTPPSYYSNGWPGPNGTPSVQCGKPGQPPCEGTGCKQGSIVVESVDKVPCGDYLGAGFIAPGAIYTYSSVKNIGTTWTVGGFLTIDTSDLAPVAVQAGFFSSFAETTTTGSSTGVSQTCGQEGAQGDFTCGLHIRPQCVAIKGYCDTEQLGRVPWANVAPQTSADGVGVFTSEICTCQNCPDSTNESAPTEQCGLECGGCL